MLTQQQLIEAARVAIARREGKPEVTYYRVGKLLGITSAYMVQLTQSKGIMSAEMAHKLAVLADIDPAYAMACIEAERASRSDSSISGTWRAIAESLRGKAATLLGGAILTAMMAHPTPADAGTYAREGDASRAVDLYIMRSRARRRRQPVAGAIRSMMRRGAQALSVPAPLACPT